MTVPAKILLATGNAHKAGEMRAILAELLPAETELVSLKQVGLRSPPGDIERHSTFTANARAKAEWCRDQSGLACIADDSGICVEALNGRPGIHSARWAGADATDAERNERLLTELDAVDAATPDWRAAMFVCSAALASPSSQDSFLRPPATLSALGVMRGFVLQRTKVFGGGGGFGYDPLFFSPELGMSVAEATAGSKNEISHRARALRTLASAIISVKWSAAISGS